MSLSYKPLVLWMLFHSKIRQNQSKSASHLITLVVHLVFQQHRLTLNSIQIPIEPPHMGFMHATFWRERTSQWLWAVEVVAMVGTSYVTSILQHAWLQVETQTCKLAWTFDEGDQGFSCLALRGCKGHTSHPKIVKVKQFGLLGIAIVAWVVWKVVCFNQHLWRPSCVCMLPVWFKILRPAWDSTSSSPWIGTLGILGCPGGGIFTGSHCGWKINQFGSKDRVLLKQILCFFGKRKRKVWKHLQSQFQWMHVWEAFAGCITLCEVSYGCHFSKLNVSVVALGPGWVGV